MAYGDYVAGNVGPARTLIDTNRDGEYDTMTVDTDGAQVPETVRTI